MFCFGQLSVERRDSFECTLFFSSHNLLLLFVCLFVFCYSTCSGSEEEGRELTLGEEMFGHTLDQGM